MRGGTRSEILNEQSYTPQVKALNPDKTPKNRTKATEAGITWRWECCLGAPSYGGQ